MERDEVDDEHISTPRRHLEYSSGLRVHFRSQSAVQVTEYSSGHKLHPMRYTLGHRVHELKHRDPDLNAVYWFIIRFRNNIIMFNWLKVTKVRTP